MIETDYPHSDTHVARLHRSSPTSASTPPASPPRRSTRSCAATPRSSTASRRRPRRRSSAPDMKTTCQGGRHERPTPRSGLTSDVPPRAPRHGEAGHALLELGRRCGEGEPEPVVVVVGGRQGPRGGHGDAVAQGVLREGLAGTPDGDPEGQAAVRLRPGPGGEGRRSALESTSWRRRQLLDAALAQLERRRACRRRSASTWPTAEDPRSCVALMRAKRRASGLGSTHEPDAQPTPEELAERTDHGDGGVGHVRGDGRGDVLPGEVGQRQVLHHGDVVLGGERRDPAAGGRRPGPRRWGCGATTGGRAALVAGPERGRQRVEPHAVAVDGGAHDPSAPAWTKAAGGARVGGVVDDHGVALADPARGRGADGLLRPRRDDDLVLVVGSPHEVTWTATARRSEGRPHGE